jgi:hypothetical protein
MKKVIGLVLCSVIVAGFVTPTVSLATEQSVSRSEVEMSATQNSQSTFENFKKFVDSKITFDGNKYVLNDPMEIKKNLIQNENKINLEIDSAFSGEMYFNYITKNIEDMNAKLASGVYHTTIDNGIAKNVPLTRQVKPEKPYQLTSHWWGLKFQSFGHNGTIDIKTLFSNSVALQTAAAAVLACTPASVFGIIPALGGGYDSLVLNSITALIEKEQDKKGIQVDTNNWVPHFSVYAN